MDALAELREKIARLEDQLATERYQRVQAERALEVVVESRDALLEKQEGHEAHVRAQYAAFAAGLMRVSGQRDLALLGWMLAAVKREKDFTTENTEDTEKRFDAERAEKKIIQMVLIPAGVDELPLFKGVI